MVWCARRALAWKATDTCHWDLYLRQHQRWRRPRPPPITPIGSTSCQESCHDHPYEALSPRRRSPRPEFRDLGVCLSRWLKIADREDGIDSHRAAATRRAHTRRGRRGDLETENRELASERIRQGLSPTVVSSCPVTSTPTPRRVSMPGAAWRFSVSLSRPPWGYGAPFSRPVRVARRPRKPQPRCYGQDRARRVERAPGEPGPVTSAATSLHGTTAGHAESAAEVVTDVSLGLAASAPV